jgi:hypothetical protein
MNKVLRVLRNIGRTRLLHAVWRTASQGSDSVTWAFNRS